MSREPRTRGWQQRWSTYRVDLRAGSTQGVEIDGEDQLEMVQGTRTRDAHDSSPVREASSRFALGASCQMSRRCSTSVRSSPDVRLEGFRCRPRTTRAVHVGKHFATHIACSTSNPTTRDIAIPRASELRHHFDTSDNKWSGQMS